MMKDKQKEMVATKTTKEIVLDYYPYVSADDDLVKYWIRKNPTEVNKLWVSLDELKREYAILKSRLEVCDNWEIDKELTDFEERFFAQDKKKDEKVKSR